MTKLFDNIFYVTTIIILCVCSQAHGEENTLWDLGVVVNKQSSKTYQQELDLNGTDKPSLKTPKQTAQIKALYSDNFIAPIMQEIKGPLSTSFNIIQKYDSMLKKLSIDDKIRMLKKSFLNKEYWKFFSLHGFIEANGSNLDIQEMYIQNLYYSKKNKESLEKLQTIKEEDVTDILLYYKIKNLIQLKLITEAQKHIDLFVDRYGDSDLLYYVNHERKLIEINYAE